MDLEKIRNSLELEINEIKANIDESDIDLRANGNWTDPATYKGWRRELREKTTELHQLNRNIKEQNRQQNDNLYKFRENAKMLLADETFKQIEGSIKSDMELILD